MFNCLENSPHITMTKLYQFLLHLQYFVSFYVNQCSVAAEPLIGEKVTVAENGEFPSAVSMGIVPGNEIEHQFCTGTLISKKHVLTAAHCLEVNNKTESFMKPGGFVVTVGSTDVTQGSKYHVKEWKTFQEWTAEKRITINYYEIVLIHDVAVITLVDTVAEDIKPAQLSPLKYEGVYNQTVVAAGWGLTNFNVTPNRLLRADLQVIDKETCLRNIFVTNFPLEMMANHFCTIARPPVSLGCGDSGGPIFVNGDEIIGVSIADCEDHEHPNQQNLHAAVIFYMQFISAILDPKPPCRKLAKIEYTVNEFYDVE